MIINGDRDVEVSGPPLVIVIDGEKFEARALQRIIALRWAMEQCGPAATVEAVLRAALLFEKHLR
ncbi:hypothetical protein [Streptosporangium sp. OZ121]|uniref:hypothetical protein n=1 Tax=unclassified Streptosporangium TaxID=2632669 RepID=UPI003F78FEB9